MSVSFEAAINAVHYEDQLAVESLSIFRQQADAVAEYLGYTPFPEDGYVLSEDDLVKLRESLGNDAQTVRSPDIHELIAFIQFATQSTSSCVVSFRRNVPHSVPETAPPERIHGH